MLAFLHRWLFLLLAVPSAEAQDPCLGVPGGCAPVNVLLNLIPATGQLLVNIAAGAAVVFVVWGGAQMMLNFGDSGKVEQGRMSVIYALLGFALVLASQTIVVFVQQFAAPVGTSADPLIAALAAAVRAMVALFNVTFTVLVIYAGVRMVIGRGQAEEFNQAKTMLIWTIGGAIVINVAHALVRALVGVVI